MSDTKSYEGSCHCGKVRYAITAPINEVMECNCSMCSRAGYLLAFVPESAFTLLAGEGATTDYLFNKQHIHHLFCSTCGVRSYGTGKGPGGATMYAVNVRCIPEIDLSALKVKKIDGKSR